MTNNLKVGLRSFTANNAEKLQKIFLATGNRERSYSIAEPNDPTDLLLVDVDGEIDLDGENDADRIEPKMPIVTIGKSDRPEWSEYHIKGQLLATRVIRVLDQVNIVAKNNHEFLNITKAPDIGIHPIVISVESAQDKTYDYAVLIVDDSELMRKSIALELDKASVSLSVDFAESGEQALTKVSAHSYDFIFLDVMMPGIDGYETCSQIRKIPEMKKTPIIMLSAKTSPLDEVKGVLAGCTNYITKPIKADEFQNMLDRIMKWLSQYKKP